MDKTYLSEKVLASLTSRQYYKPETLMAQTSLSRLEKITVSIEDVGETAARALALKVAAAINGCVAQKRMCVMCAGSGDAEIAVLRQLVQLYFNDQVDFEDVVFFNLCEIQFFDDPSNVQSHYGLDRIGRHFLSKVNIDADRVFTFAPCSNHAEQIAAAQAYEKLIGDYGGIDVMLCQVNPNCTLALNEPGSEPGTVCRGVMLGTDTRNRLSAAFHHSAIEPHAITLGVSDILAAKQLFVPAFGLPLAAAVKQCVEGEISSQACATYVQMHRDAVMQLDLIAASQLTRITTPWLVTNCEWTRSMAVRAAMWLSGKLQVPVLELSQRHYTEHGLADALTAYGSVESLNADAFWAIKDTVTGWPGGKPDVADAHRPVPGTPYPKRVLVLSPHPDDAVVTMGATLQRLVQQGHEVHVGIQTSGDVAVSDNNLMRVLLMHQRMGGLMASHMGPNAERDLKLTRQMIDLISKKRPGTPDSPSVRTIKGCIFESEAEMSLVQRLGIKPEHLQFLSMPFYTDNPNGIGPVTDADIAVVRGLIEQVKPHMIFFGVDLGDAYGTHLRASSAVVGALQQLEHEPWMRGCQVWMCCGQWSTWALDTIGMTVPMSPEEFADKRRAILSFQSQVHMAPYLDGTHTRLPWQRALDYNQQLAQTIAGFGLPTYEAVESFVRYPVQL